MNRAQQGSTCWLQTPAHSPTRPALKCSPATCPFVRSPSRRGWLRRPLCLPPRRRPRLPASQPAGAAAASLCGCGPSWASAPAWPSSQVRRVTSGEPLCTRVHAVRNVASLVSPQPACLQLSHPTCPHLPRPPTLAAAFIAFVLYKRRAGRAAATTAVEPKRTVSSSRHSQNGFKDGSKDEEFGRSSSNRPTPRGGATMAAVAVPPAAAAAAPMMPSPVSGFGSSLCADRPSWLAGHGTWKQHGGQPCCEPHSNCVR